MLFINEDNEFAISTELDEGVTLTLVLDDYNQNVLRKLMHLLINGNIKKLNKFVKKYKLEMNHNEAMYIFLYAMDKAKFDNLMWFADFSNFDLQKFCQYYQGDHVAVDDSFISDLIEAYIDFEPNFSVMISNLKKIGFNLNQRYEDDFIILHYVASLHMEDSKLHQDLVRALLDNGADPNIKNDDNESVLQYAANAEIANYLIQQPEYNPVYKYTKKTRTVVIDPANFSIPSIYEYCLKHGGVDVAISRIESGLLANVVSEVCNSKVNNPAPRRI